MTKASPLQTAVKKETLAEQVAGSLKEAILDGRWEAGEALPTEQELAGLFGVSRAVVRDATRMLAAQGLVQAQHGRGVFVTDSQVEAFGDALLLALRREKATVWDVEQFEQMVFPEVCALAAAQATKDEIAQIKTLAADYIALFRKSSVEPWESESPEAEIMRARTSAAFAAFIVAIFEATHNALWQLLARPIINLRSIRSWEVVGEEEEPLFERFIAMEKRFVDTLFEAIAGGDPQSAREVVARLMRLPSEAEDAMRRTPVGKTPHIQVSQRPPSFD